MPRKDPEQYKAYMKDAMRRRRAQQKSSGELASPPTPSLGETPPTGVSQLDSGLAPTPSKTSMRVISLKTKEKSSEPQMTKPLLPYIEDFRDLNNRWSAHQGQGFPCYKVPGHCCLPLDHDLPRKAVTGCVFPIPGCAYFKGDGE